MSLLYKGNRGVQEAYERRTLTPHNITKKQITIEEYYHKNTRRLVSIKHFGLLWLSLDIIITVFVNWLIVLVNAYPFNSVSFIDSVNSCQ